MKIFRLFTFLCLFFCGINSMYALEQRDLLRKEASLEQVASSLIMNQQWISAPAYKDRAGWDQFLGKYKAKYIRMGEKQLNYEWQLVRATDYLEFLRSGDRYVMQRPFSDNKTALAALFMAEMAEGKGRFIDQIINGVFTWCEMTSWAYSAHMSLQKAPGSLPNYEEHVIDLGAGEIANLLSWVYYYLNPSFDEVNPLISKRLKHELQVRILDTYMNVNHFWWMGFGNKPGRVINNWNPWCNFNVLQCFLLLENDRETLAKAVHRTMLSVDYYLNYIHGDGACEEGPSYWRAAAGRVYEYLQLLSDATGGEISLFDEPLIKKMGEYIVRSYVGDGWVVNFADASAKGGGNAELIYSYGKAIHSDLMQHYASFLKTQSAKDKLPNGSPFSLFQELEARKELKQVSPDYEVPSYTWYPETQFCFLSNKSGFFVGAKGGNNNESHNHNDVGTFSFYFQNTPFIIDAGVGTYCRQTFSSERYTIWTMQSDYHNLPKINGVSQKNGAEFKAKDVSFNPQRHFFSADISSAYPEEANVSKWIRSYRLESKALVVKDVFTLKKADQNNQVNFLTWGKVDVSVPGKVIIEVAGKKMQMAYDKNIFETTVEMVQLDDPKLSNVWGKQIYRVSLNAKNKDLTDTYTYRFTKIK